jgi:hypothetical protein
MINDNFGPNSATNWGLFNKILTRKLPKFILLNVAKRTTSIFFRPSGNF